MARERVVTRTIEDCIVDVTAMETIDGHKELVERTFHLGGQVSEDKALKIAQKMYNDEYLKIVEVNKFYKEMTIYGMKETDFIRLAKPMNDERKFIMDDGTEVSADDAETDEPVEDEKPNKKSK